MFVANILGCKKEVMPFIYLQLPMGSTRPKVDDLMCIISRREKVLSGIASKISYSGTFVHLKAVISSLPIFVMCCIRVPLTILYTTFKKLAEVYLV